MSHAAGPPTYAPTPGPQRLVDLPRYVAAELRRLGAFVTETAAEVYPGPVLVLQAASFAEQAPTAVGAGGVVEVEFGPAQGSGTDLVALSAAGVITFQQSGSWLVDLRMRAEAGNNSRLSVRALIDGVSVGVPGTWEAGPDGVVLLVSTIYTIEAGQQLTCEIGREGPVDDGALVAGVSGLGWSDIPSAAIRVMKF